MDGSRLWNTHKIHGPKILKLLPWQQALPDTPLNLVSSRSSWVYMGLGCGTLTNFVPPLPGQHRRLLPRLLSVGGNKGGIINIMNHI